MLGTEQKLVPSVEDDIGIGGVGDGIHWDYNNRKD